MQIYGVQHIEIKQTNKKSPLEISLVAIKPSALGRVLPYAVSISK